jgi:hypothetical protein
MVTPTRTQRIRSPSLAPSRAESIAREIQNQRSTGDHMLAMFEKDATAESQSQVQSTPTKSLISEPVSKSSAGYSKNTGMAMGLLRREIEAIEEEDKVIGLAQIADKVCSPSHYMAKLMDRHQNEQHQLSSLNCSYWVPGTLSSSTKRLHSVISISGPRINCLQRSQLRQW